MKNKYEHILTKRFFEVEYYQNKKSFVMIANELNINSSVIARYFKRLGLKQSLSKTEQILSVEFFNLHYFELKKSFAIIAKEFNFNRDTVRKQFHRLELQKRSFSEQAKYTKRPDNFIELCRQAQAKRTKTKTHIDVVCKICGKQKRLLEYNHKEGMVHVCSVECWSKLMQQKNRGAKRKPEMGEKLRRKFQTGKYIPCAICGELKYFPTHKIERNEFYFCSKKCYNEAKEKIYIGEKSNCWKDGRTPLVYAIRGCKYNAKWIQTRLKKDNYTCQDCGKKSSKLEVHHIKPFRTILQEFLDFYKQLNPIDNKAELLKLSKTWVGFWDENNGITYCAKCHEKNDIYRRLKKTLEKNNERIIFN